MKSPQVHTSLHKFIEKLYEVVPSCVSFSSVGCMKDLVVDVKVQ